MCKVNDRLIEKTEKELKELEGKLARALAFLEKNVENEEISDVAYTLLLEQAVLMTSLYRVLSARLEVMLEEEGIWDDEAEEYRA
jgi:hypothetical protein